VLLGPGSFVEVCKIIPLFTVPSEEALAFHVAPTALLRAPFIIFLGATHPTLSRDPTSYLTYIVTPYTASERGSLSATRKIDAIS
jgi:hypothetical protein